MSYDEINKEIFKTALNQTAFGPYFLKREIERAVPRWVGAGCPNLNVEAGKYPDIIDGPGLSLETELEVMKHKCSELHDKLCQSDEHNQTLSKTILNTQKRYEAMLGKFESLQERSASLNPIKPFWARWFCKNKFL